MLFFLKVRKAPLRCRPTFKGLYNTGSGLEGNCRIPLAFSLREREKFLGIKQFGKEVLGFFSLRSELGIVLGSGFSFFSVVGLSMGVDQGSDRGVEERKNCF